jgi:hypothetical protein
MSMIKESINDSMAHDSAHASKVFGIHEQIEDLLILEAKSSLNTTNAAVIEQ